MEEKFADNYVNFIINHTVPKSMTIQEIKDATESDITLKKVQECMRTRKWDEKDKPRRADNLFRRNYNN